MKRKRQGKIDVSEPKESDLSHQSGPIMYTNKHRCLVFGSRGLSARYRHLLDDVRALIPHHKKDSKVC